MNKHLLSIFPYRWPTCSIRSSSTSSALGTAVTRLLALRIWDSGSLSADQHPRNNLRCAGLGVILGVVRRASCAYSRLCRLSGPHRVIDFQHPIKSTYPAGTGLTLSTPVVFQTRHLPPGSWHHPSGDPFRLVRSPPKLHPQLNTRRDPAAVSHLLVSLGYEDRL